MKIINKHFLIKMLSGRKYLIARDKIMPVYVSRHDKVFLIALINDIMAQPERRKVYLDFKMLSESSDGLKKFNIFVDRNRNFK